MTVNSETKTRTNQSWYLGTIVGSSDPLGRDGIGVVYNAEQQFRARLRAQGVGKKSRKTPRDQWRISPWFNLYRILYPEDFELT